MQKNEKLTVLVMVVCILALTIFECITNGILMGLFIMTFCIGFSFILFYIIGKVIK